MTRLSGWLSAYGWASTSASRINAAAEHQLTPVACIASSVSRHRAKLLDTMLLNSFKVNLKIVYLIKYVEKINNTRQL